MPTRPPLAWSANTTSSHTEISRSRHGQGPRPLSPTLRRQVRYRPTGCREGRTQPLDSDAGWGVFLAILLAKAESAGREVIAVDPRNTSRTRPECGRVAAEGRPSQERLPCVSCGHRRTRTPWARSTFYGPG
ncbi:zinc ribbon domain-containing protein [Streptomyces sp. NPDC013457]|uniref:zinc ribbon domain-containing protein n=1 Tax=Streptomyces sp. NPDC013457 TaxID=3364866 RepID=UPI003701B3D7